MNGIINLLIGCYCLFQLYTFATMNARPEMVSLFGVMDVPTIAYMGLLVLLAGYCFYGARGLLKGKF